MVLLLEKRDGNMQDFSMKMELANSLYYLWRNLWSDFLRSQTNFISI